MEIKRQIVESKFPPSNNEVWWFDVNSKEIKRYTEGKWTAVVTSSGGNTPEPEPDLSLKLSTGSDKELWIKIKMGFVDDYENAYSSIDSIRSMLPEYYDLEEVEIESGSNNDVILKITSYPSFTPETIKDIFTYFITSLHDDVSEQMADSFYITLVLPSGIDTLVNGLIPTNGISDYDGNELTIVSDSIKSIESIFDGDADMSWFVSLVLGMDTPPQIQTDSFLVALYPGSVTIRIPHGTIDRYLKDTNWEIINAEYQIHELEEGITLEDVLESY